MSVIAGARAGVARGVDEPVFVDEVEAPAGGTGDTRTRFFPIGGKPIRCEHLLQNLFRHWNEASPAPPLEKAADFRKRENWVFPTLPSLRLTNQTPHQLLGNSTSATAPRPQRGIYRCPALTSKVDKKHEVL